MKKISFKIFAENPSADWHSSLMIFVIALVCLLFVDAVIYSQLLLREASAPVTINANLPTIDRNDISAVAEAERQKDIDSGGVPKSAVADPSI